MEFFRRASSLLLLQLLLAVRYYYSFAFVLYPGSRQQQAIMTPPQGSAKIKAEAAFNTVSSGARYSNTTSTLEAPTTIAVMKPAASESTTATTTTVYGIRHGISVSNEWMMEPGNEWGSATYHDGQNSPDSPLSETGVQQATALSRRLLLRDEKSDDWLSNIELIVVSPLTRCLQTYWYGVHPVITAAGFREIPVVAHPWMTERVYTVSETGRPVSILRKEFPGIDWSLFPVECNLDDDADWWYDPDVPTEFNGAATEASLKEWRPHAEGQVYYAAGEPMSVFQRRMEALQQWLVNRPESHILAVGHWGVFRHFTGQEMDNCQVCTFKLK
jgi:broad specificity phosphatase PhoE